MSMRLGLVAVCLLALAAVPAMAVEGYVFVAPGGASVGGTTNGTLQMGGGGEHVFGNRFGVGAELSALGPWRDYGSAIGVLSTNGSYHFADRRAKVDPFVTGGYSLGFRNGTMNMANFGAGVNYWFGERIGFRTEFRNHLRVNDNAPNQNYWGVRVGLSFR
jgi:hypothetical protein